MCSEDGDDARGDLCVATKTNYVEILNFRHFSSISSLRVRAIKSEIKR